MPKGVYTDEDKARAYVVWKASKENISATARETGYPAQTIRDWRNIWEREGPPDPELVDTAVSVFVDDVERVRNKALSLLDARMHQIKNPKDLATVFGILDDKVRLARGLATSRSESVQSLPNPQQLGELMVGMVQGMLKAKEERDADIIDVLPVEEQAKALPAGE